MKIIYNIESMKEILTNEKKQNRTISLVPTMGALHKGHLSLIKESKKKSDVSVVSIFVNPLQFSPNEDLDKYPRTFEEDKNKLEKLDIDFLFYPSYDEMYKKPTITMFDMPIFHILCGKSRKSHFSGVCVIVAKLFNIISPDIAIFGKKDYQQYIIIKKLVEDLNFDINILGMPIVRDYDGLALSSRNMYLSKNERLNALSINNSRDIIKKYYNSSKNNNIKEIILILTEHLIENNIIIDYIEIRESNTLEPSINISSDSRIFIAGYSGKTRLIDNFSIEECLLF